MTAGELRQAIEQVGDGHEVLVTVGDSERALATVDVHADGTIVLTAEEAEAEVEPAPTRPRRAPKPTKKK